MVGGYVISGLLFDSHTRRGCAIAVENVQFGLDYRQTDSQSDRETGRLTPTDTDRWIGYGPATGIVHVASHRTHVVDQFARGAPRGWGRG